MFSTSFTPIAAVRVPTTEELAASAATFVAPLQTVDKLHLKPFDTGLPRTGLWRNGFDLADIDGDGQVDFVHGPPRRSGDQMRAFHRLGYTSDETLAMRGLTRSDEIRRILDLPKQA